MAWQEFVRGKRARRDVQEFDLDLMVNLFTLHEQLVTFRYRHSPYHAFNVSDPKPRNIHKATVADRIVHRALYRRLYPFFDRTFIADSFSCRNGKGTHKALDRFRRFAWQESQNHTRTIWVLKCDIRMFFASIDHGVLLRLLDDRIADKRILWLAQRIIGSFHSGAPGKGLPLGNLTSQLFANVFMDPLDQFAKHFLKAKRYIRYADDFVFLSSDREFLLAVLDIIRRFLPDQLKLTLHPDKIVLKTIASGVDFLGWVHFPDHRVLRTATKRRAVRAVSAGAGLATIVSYRGLLGYGNTRELASHLS